MNTGPFKFKNLTHIYSNPKSIVGGIRYLGKEINRKYHKDYIKHEGCDIMKEDWDNLIILDGCRYDILSEKSFSGGNLEYRFSKGSQSKEFIEQNFLYKNLHDTVYITVNPFANIISENTFHYIHNLLDTHWDSNLKTVHPDKVTNIARRAAQEYKDKRLIVHYMQPHYPFIGKRGQEHETGSVSSDSTDNNMWDIFRFNITNMDIEKVWDLYDENLDVVLNSVDRLRDDLIGKTVITSDHGNLFGEKLSPVPTRWYGHPPNLYVDELVQVPWLTFESDDRKDIRSDSPVGQVRVKKEEVNERLEHLGYI